MASYVSQWLNNEVKLSTYVTAPNKQFANGYLFGELLLALGWLSEHK